MPLTRLPDATQNIPDTTSTIWVSKAARDYWEPLINQISVSWQEVEFLSVADGLREAAILAIQPNNILDFSRRVIDSKLYMTMLGKMADTGMYSSRHVAEITNKFQYRIAIHREPEYFEDNQHQAEARLGYPVCCVSNFDYWWNQQHYFDLTWPQYENSKGEFHPLCNVMLRCLGVRPVFHLPCGFYCDATREMAQRIQALMLQHGMAKISQTIHKLCDMPMEWSALHGYAEIRTPIFKIVTKTDATPFEYKFQKPGAFIPVHSGSGLAFPFANEQRVKLTETVSFHKSLEFPPDDNGFQSEKDEREAHAWLMKEIEQFMNPSEKRSLVDLGCGNGRLLQILRRRFSSYSLSGVEVSIDKCQRAEKLLNGSGISIECKNIFQYDMVKKDYILVAEQRFQENYHLIDKLDGMVVCYNYTTRKVYTWSSATIGMQTLQKLTGFGDNIIQSSLASRILATPSSPVSLIVEKELEDSGLLNSLPKDSL